MILGELGVLETMSRLVNACAHIDRIFTHCYLHGHGMNILQMFLNVFPEHFHNI